MRLMLTSLALVLAPAIAFAAPPEKFCYLGEAKLSSGEGKPMGSQVILVEKIHDSDNSLILERAIVVQPDGKAEERAMRMTVKDDNTFTLVDDAKTIEGTGTLFGPAWKWTYFKATFKAQNKATIKDENYMADESAITARKKVTIPGGRVVMYMDMTVKAVPPATFEILRAGLMKK
jgi:hypothetical protein